jgi:hypothetical protein
MAQRDRKREPVVVAAVAFEPSRLARECLARAYGAAAPPGRRRPGADRRPPGSGGAAARRAAAGGAR